MPRKVLIVADSEFGPEFWKLFADHGKEKEQSSFEVLTLDPWLTAAYRDHQSRNRVIPLDNVSRHYGESQIDKESLVEYLRAIESSTGTPIIDIIQADRHLGRGYFWGGQRHPTSALSRRASYWHTLALIRASIDAISDVLLEVEPDVVLVGGVASLPTKVLCVSARARGIPLRVAVPPRAGNLFSWAEDEFLIPLQLPETYQALQNHTGAAPSAQPYAEPPGPAGATQLKNRFHDYGKISGLIKAATRRTLTHVYQRTLLRHLNERPEHYDISSMLRYQWNIFRDARHLESITKDDPTNSSIRYLFYPLHVEPEASLMVLSPEFGHQGAVIELISKALPAGVMLMVKEHLPALGRRPPGFYDWLSAIPNVILVSPNENGAQLARNSIATVTFTGTAGLEAAIHGVPVITFGQHNMYNLIPHVHVTTDIAKVRGTVKQIVAEAGDREAQEQRQRDGQLFLQALKGVSIDLGEQLVRGPSKQPPSQETIANIYDQLVSTLPDQR